MQNRHPLKYTVYKAIFSLVLCGFFFAQTRASFIEHAYNDSEGSTSALFFHKTFHSQKTAAVTACGGAYAKYKLNKRFQPVASPAILPCGFQQLLVFYAESPGTIVLNTHPLLTGFLLSKKLRGPPQA